MASSPRRLPSVSDHLPSKTIIQINEFCLLGDLIMSMQSCFPSVSDKCLSQDALLSTTLLTCIELCLPADTLSSWIHKQTCKGLLNVTDKEPFHDHISSTTLLTHWVQSTLLANSLSPRRPEQWMYRAVFPVSLMKSLFKTIFQVKLSWIKTIKRRCNITFF